MHLCLYCEYPIHPNIFRKKSKCPHCHRIKDRYIGKTLTYKIIDILLLKRQVFLHLIYNNTLSFKNALVILESNLLMMYLKYVNSNTSIVKQLIFKFIELICLKILFIKIDPKLFNNAYFISCFYVPVIILQQIFYKYEFQYYLVTEILAICLRVVSFGCLKPNRKIIIVLVILRLIFYII